MSAKKTTTKKKTTRKKSATRKTAAKKTSTRAPKEKVPFWYRVELMNGDETYCFFGSSTLTEDQFVKKLSSLEYVMLENLVYFNEDQEPRSWAEWDPMLQPRVHLNPKYVVSLLPLNGDPRKQPGTENKILSLPGLTT
ncbi:MAG: hypothetical protein AAF492_04120 [Verrucomicrobiota bacterium]